MDMEMDIPAPEELEWLEANAFLPEEEEEAAAAVDEEEWMIEEGRDPSGFHAAEYPDLLPDSENQICRKRPLSVAEEGLEDHGKLLTDNGRTIRRRSLEDEQDEDWFRYSPPKDAAADAASEMDAAVPAVPEEKILSRFASEIEGDCMPVTGPSGVRVYAKISSAQTDVDHRKLLFFLCFLSRTATLFFFLQPLYSFQLFNRSLDLISSISDVWPILILSWNSSVLSFFLLLPFPPIYRRNWHGSGFCMDDSKGEEGKTVADVNRRGREKDYLSACLPALLVLWRCERPPLCMIDIREMRNGERATSCLLLCQHNIDGVPSC